jgi:hypothetical protein
MHFVLGGCREKVVAWLDVPHDPTLQRSFNERCRRCYGHEAVFFQLQKEDAVQLWLVCATQGCGHHWIAGQIDEERGDDDSNNNAVDYS